jgi:DNA-binding transcriptional MerR regulator
MATKRRKVQPTGSQLGGQAVSGEFAAHLTRKRYLELVGISKSTLIRWEKAGALRPEMHEILGIPTRVFTPEDVELGKRLRRVLRERYGEISVEEAAKLVRRR